MEEAGLQPHIPEEDEENEPENDAELIDNHDSRSVPENQEILEQTMLLSEQQSYQLYIPASKPAAPDLEDANITLNDGADGDDNTLYSQEIDIQHSRASDESLRRRRVRIFALYLLIWVKY